MQGSTPDTHLTETGRLHQLADDVEERQLLEDDVRVGGHLGAAGDGGGRRRLGRVVGHVGRRVAATATLERRRDGRAVTGQW